MSPDGFESWKKAFKKSVDAAENISELKDLINKATRLRIAITVFGKVGRIKPLDLDGVGVQIFNERMCHLFPRPKGRAIPCVQDSHFWKLEISKVIDPQERLEIEISPIRDTSATQN